MRLKSGNAMDSLRHWRRMPLVPSSRPASRIRGGQVYPIRPNTAVGTFARAWCSAANFGTAPETEEQSLLCSCSQTETQASEEHEWRTVDTPRVRDMTNLLKLPTWADDEYVFAVVETPRSSTCKLDFDPKLGVFTLAKPRRSARCPDRP